MAYDIIVPSTEWTFSPDQLHRAAKLVYLSDNIFYDRFFPNRGTLLFALGKALVTHGSDLSTHIIATDNDKVVGICCGYPAKEMLGRQLTTMRSLANQLGKEEMKHLSAFSSELPKPPTQSAYLAKIAVSETYRKRGVGHDLLQAFETLAVNWAEPMVSLHVHRDNDAAAFYKTQGYVSDVHTDSEYLLLMKTLK